MEQNQNFIYSPAER